MSTKTSNIFARVEPELKAQAEAVLNEIGLPMSNAITLFLRQIVLRRGVPFPVTIPLISPPTLDAMSKEQFDTELEKGFDDIKAGRVRPADEFFSEMEIDDHEVCDIIQRG
ncbi:MAG: type II toxin-antitoxin system RelB/DinJ family antitoxin [Oscillospiraceae bacterium]|nr:type II toxin-antitoxin system RelB/DinJ family antitoxin [Oscillospiraceae bacterium]